MILSKPRLRQMQKVQGNAKREMAIQLSEPLQLVSDRASPSERKARDRSSSCVRRTIHALKRNRTRAAAALPSVIGRVPVSDLIAIANFARLSAMRSLYDVIR
jgi:hypothetical protein